MAGPGGNSEFCFPRMSMFPFAAPRGNIEILGKNSGEAIATVGM